MTVLAADDEESFTLSPEQERALRIAIAEAERGEGVEAEAFLEQLTPLQPCGNRSEPAGC